MNSPVGGDEVLFISDLELIKKMGWIEAIRKNISIPYMILSYPFSIFLKNYLALRIANICVALFFFIYVLKDKKKENSLVLYYLLFFFSTVGMCYVATNDFIFDVSLVIFLNETYKKSQNKTANINLAFTSLILAFFTRQLFVVFLPIIFLSIYVYYRKGIKFNKYSFIPLLVFLIFSIANIPSITKTHTLSWDNKLPPSYVKSSWSQRQYLAQLLVNDNKLEDGKHPSWEETDNYLKIHGSDSLPNGILNGMLFDVKLTIKEFFKNFYYCLTYQIRSLGLVFFISIFLMLFQVFKRNFTINDFFIPLSTLIMLVVFSLIIISYVELRWLQPVFIMLLIYFSDVEKKNKFPLYLTNINVLFFSLLSIYGMIRIFNKI